MGQAYVNWGRWVVDCGCCSAMALEGFPSEVKCFECGEVQVVIYPAERDAIEAILALRPGKILGGTLAYPNRNWKPGESVRDLQKENRDHGLGGIDGLD